MIETVAIMGLANLISSREDIVHIQHYATTHKKRKNIFVVVLLYIWKILWPNLSFFLPKSVAFTRKYPYWTWRKVCPTIHKVYMNTSAWSFTASYTSSWEKGHPTSLGKKGLKELKLVTQLAWKKRASIKGTKTSLTTLEKSDQDNQNLAR
jgi:hypothetical protein